MMAGTCYACKANITVTQKRIKCVNCTHLYHSDCAKYNNDSATRSQWNCPACVAGQRKGGDNSNTPVPNTGKSSKDLSVSLPKNERVTSQSTSPALNPGLSPTVTAAAAMSDVNVTLTSSEYTIVTQIEQVLDSKLRLLKNEMVEELKSSLIVEFRKELTVVTAKHDQLEISHTKLLGEHETLKKDFDILEKKNAMDSSKILDIQAQLNKQQQWARMSNIEIVGLPETPNESAVALAVKIASHVGVQLQPSQIESAYRVQPMQKVEGRPKPIVVKLQTRMLKDQIISGLRRTKGITTRDLGLNGADRRFFVNEHLTPENKQLLNAAKSRAKDKSYKFVWVRNCNIFLRKNEESPIITVSSEKDLRKII